MVSYSSGKDILFIPPLFFSPFPVYCCMAKPIILTVDDDPAVLRSIARDLRRRYGKDYRIMRASSPQEAIDAIHQLAQRNDPIALFLSDQRMPLMDGVGFLNQAMQVFPDAKRALLTAYADTNAAIGAINESKIHYYLLKPWDPPEEKLYPIIDDLLEDWKANYRPGYKGIRIVGDRWSAHSHTLKDFLARNQIPYTFLDVETSDEAYDLVHRGDGSPDQLPLVFLPDGAKLIAPTAAELANHVGMQTKASTEFYDLAIIGAGPAGLASAVYGASEGLRTVLLEREAPGGQAGTSSRIENYLGFPAGLSGSDLARRAVAQARKFGVEILTPTDVESLRIEGPYKILKLTNGTELSCHVLMLSMGVSWRRLPAPGADNLAGRGVYYGAAMTEALNCKGQEVYIVGAGNSAGQAAMYFAKYAGKVVMLVRGSSLEAKMSQYLVDQINATDNIDVRLREEIVACHGTDNLEGLTIKNNETAQTYEAATNFVFIFIGAAPRTQWLEGHVSRDRRGFVLTGPDLEEKTDLKDWPLERAPFLLETNVPGIFAAGDVRHESVKRVASAVGEGSVAVHFMHRHLASL